MTLGDIALRDAVSSAADPRFAHALLVFRDGSHIRFEHSSRQSRWARASVEASTADRVCGGLARFRLNRKHLQLFFKDGSEAEFRPVEEWTDGATLGSA
jgi:hypothetical protein